ncbi:MAG: cytochrome c3 family protein, partial [Planctomycetales bacterium]|nr:cytochrome c3 family protein [Planctomycetales bacterium]
RVAGDERSEPPVNRRAPEASGPLGRWETDETTLALRYFPAGHADVLLKDWLDAFAAAATGAHANVADPLLRDLVKPTAPGQCGMCHSLQREPRGELAMQWLARTNATSAGAPGDDQREPPAAADPSVAPLGARSARPQPPSANHELTSVAPRVALTHFAHGPHLTQPQLADCASCHRIAAGADVMTTYAHDQPEAFTPGFESLQKSECAACHRPQAAGDSCTQCHRYHP